MTDNLRARADRIVRALREAGHKAYFAGGSVRDMIMDQTPRDYDIATDARPEDVTSLFDSVIPVGKEFGVVVVIVDGAHFEVTTFRREGPYLDGRRPSTVEFTDEEEDAHRRDFTINGIFYDPIADRYLDYVGGREDIRWERIRCIGDPESRFREDRLRLVRGVRFAARFRFELDAATRAAMVKMASRVLDVSVERIRDELIKILLDPWPHEGIRLMHEVGLLGVILPEVAAMDGVEQPPEFHPEGDVLTHTLLMLEHMNPPADPRDEDVRDRESGGPEGDGRIVPATPILALGVLLHDIGKPVTMEVKDRIRFNNHTGVGAEMAEAILRGDPSGSLARPEPPEIHRGSEYAGEQAETVPPVGWIRGTPRASPARLPGQPRGSVEPRLLPGTVEGAGDRVSHASPADFRRRSDRAGVRTGADL
jgi:poly(A) polymerase